MFHFHFIAFYSYLILQSCCFYGTSISMATDCEAINTIFNLVWEKEVRLWMKTKPKYLNWKLKIILFVIKKQISVVILIVLQYVTTLFWVQVIHDLAFWIISSHKNHNFSFPFFWQMKDFEDLPITLLICRFLYSPE